MKENTSAIEILTRASKTEDLLAAPSVFYHEHCMLLVNFVAVVLLDIQFTLKIFTHILYNR